VEPKDDLLLFPITVKLSAAVYDDGANQWLRSICHNLLPHRWKASNTGGTSQLEGHALTLVCQMVHYFPHTGGTRANSGNVTDARNSLSAKPCSLELKLKPETLLVTSAGQSCWRLTLWNLMTFFLRQRLTT
jgi:hypothetical protein